ncbi:MAG: hypothetical protein JWQ18_2463, partial [Conexibacter sp.]|nr:hypothetical protein [Conexibacter sp.]
HGRGVDTTRMRRDLRFVPTHTTAEAIDAVAAAVRAEHGHAHASEAAA